MIQFSRVVITICSSVRNPVNSHIQISCINGQINRSRIYHDSPLRKNKELTSNLLHTFARHELALAIGLCTFSVCVLDFGCFNFLFSIRPYLVFQAIFKALLSCCFITLCYLATWVVVRTKAVTSKCQDCCNNTSNNQDFLPFSHSWLGWFRCLTIWDKLMDSWYIITWRLTK